jgi:hypothetical protein
MISMPGFGAESSLGKFARYGTRAVAVEHFRGDVYPAYSRGPFYVVPDFCPPGQRPTLVKVGGGRQCVLSIPWYECVFVGGGFADCRYVGERCLTYAETPVRYEWQCQRATFQVAE